MKLVYGVKDRPSIGKTLVFALQQLLAILAATITVPVVIGHGMSQSAALFGAGIGTLVYLLFTKFKSPVFLGSSFAFLGSMFAAFAGGITLSVAEQAAVDAAGLIPEVNIPTGFLGLLIGAAGAGLVYVIIAAIVKFCGTKWINKVMPAVVIGPTVAIIGLSLAGNAIGDLQAGSFASTNIYVALVCGLITLATVVVCSVYGKKMAKMIPFILGILAGYAAAAIFTGIGYAANKDALKVIDFTAFKHMQWYPKFTFIEAFKGGYGYNKDALDAIDGGLINISKFSIGSYIGTVLVAYVPVAFVVFAEHIADHKNLSSIIESDLLEDPGLHRTLLGDGVGSIAGAFFGGCPNTTYGESVGCVAISGNASVSTILVTACLAIVSAFIAPLTTFLATIPHCVMGGVCVTLYGFIAVSGLKMIQPVDLGDNRNLFPVATVLITGIGGLSLTFGQITITSNACALILGILVNLLCSIGRNKEQAPASDEGATVSATKAE